LSVPSGFVKEQRMSDLREAAVGQFRNVVLYFPVEYVPLLAGVRDTMFSRMPSTCIIETGFVHQYLCCFASDSNC